MREIKFRAWDTYNNKMIPEKDGFYLGSATCEMMGGDDYPPMQYTGLKDKNGKEIYEGDILNIMNRLIGTVIYEPPTYGIKTSGGYRNFCVPFNQAGIIGNVYENPELLKEAS